MRTDLSALSDEEYRKYKRTYNAKRQRVHRARARKLGVPYLANMSVYQRVMWKSLMSVARNDL